MGLIGWNEAMVQITAINGFLTESEARCLYLLAQNCGGTIVEIGSWKGKSTVCLALGSKAGGKGKVFAIDPHQGLADDCAQVYLPEKTEAIFRKNISRAQVDDIVTPLVMTSEDASKDWEEAISMLFIDGAHDAENARLDFTLWYPYLQDGGVICFHDAIYRLSHNQSGVRKVVCKYVLRSNRFQNIGFADTIVFATKVDKISLLGRISKSLKIAKWHVLPISLYLRRLLAMFLVKVKLYGFSKWIKNNLDHRLE